MSLPKKHTLEELLADFNGEVPDPDGKGTTPLPELPEGAGSLEVTDEEMAEATAKGPGGLVDLIHDKLKAFAKAHGVDIAEVRVVDKGIVIAKGDSEIHLDVAETVQLHEALGSIIRRQMDLARAAMIRKLMGLDD